MNKLNPNNCPGNRIVRPGIAPETLQQNGIEHIDRRLALQRVGLEQSGIWTPYRTFDGGQAVPIIEPATGPYGRLRLDDPESVGHKYHGPPGASVHSYLPIELILNPRIGEPISFTEGEFKSISLMDKLLGYWMQAIGLSGLYGYHLKGEDGTTDVDLQFTKEVETFLSILKPSVVYFIGDTDTAFNRQFAHAAVRLAKMLGKVIRLPRTPIDKPKGIDDCRQEMGDKFEWFIREACDNAVEVSPSQSVDELAFKLAKGELERLKSLSGEVRVFWMRKLTKLLADIDDEPRNELCRMAKALKIATLRELGDSVKRRQREDGDKTRKQLEADVLKRVVDRIFFDGKAYYVKNEDHYDVVSRREDVLLYLSIDFGFYGNCLRGKTAEEHALHMIQKHCRVDWAGKLAGHMAGLFERGSSRVLVTHSFVHTGGSKSGDASLIVQLAADLMGADTDEPFYHEQIQRLFGWLACRRRALLNPTEHLPGQILVLVGRGGVGKGFFVDKVITPLLGGRIEDIFPILRSGTRFNDRMFGAEVLKVADAKLDTRSNREITDFQTALFRLVTESEQVADKKYGDSLTLAPIWSVVMTANPAPDALQLLRLHDQDMRDKLLILRCHGSEILPDEKAESRRRFLARLEQELPAFAGQLDAYQLPQDLRGDRFGVAPFQHPEILNAASAAHVPTRVACMLNQLRPQAGEESIHCTARDLWAQLKQAEGVDFEKMVPGYRELGKVLSAIPREVPGWNSRLWVDGKLSTGVSRNYAKAWRILAHVS